MLRAQGKSVNEAAALIGYKGERSGYGIEKILKRHGLQSFHKIKLASSAVNSLLSGTAIGESKPPDAETIRKTAQMVYDRAQPLEVPASNPTTVNLAYILQEAHRSMMETTPGLVLPPAPPAPPALTDEEREAATQAYKESRFKRYQAHCLKEAMAIPNEPGESLNEPQPPGE